MFNFSNYSANSKFYNSNALVVGKVKDEAKILSLKEFVGPKPDVFVTSRWF